jgi:hypothetical protein
VSPATNPPRTSTSAEQGPVASRVVWRVPSWITPRVAKAVLWSLVFIWAAWLASGWIRDSLSPSTAVSTPASSVTLDLDSTVTRAAGVPLFGEMSPSDAPEATRNTFAIKLKGVIAGLGGPTVAIVNTGGERDEMVQLHSELRPGVVLKGVYPTHVVISRNGVDERVELEVPRSDDSRAAPRESPPTASRPPEQPARAAPRAGHGPEGRPAPTGEHPTSRPPTETEPNPAERQPQPSAPGSKPEPGSVGRAKPAGGNDIDPLASITSGLQRHSAALFTPGAPQFPG